MKMCTCDALNGHVQTQYLQDEVGKQLWETQQADKYSIILVKQRVKMGKRYTTQ